MQAIDFKTIFLNPVHLLAFGFGAGLSPWMPGTVGTLVALPLFYLCKWCALSDWMLLVLTMVAAIFGCFLCDKTSKNLGVHDHSGIVWDEIVAMFALLLLVPATWAAWLVMFVLFRLFDMLKPFPISYLDRHVKGGFGIMLDDVAAALLAWLLWLVLWQSEYFQQWILSSPAVIF